jgi:hypothetical protein
MCISMKPAKVSDKLIVVNLLANSVRITYLTDYSPLEQISSKITRSGNPSSQFETPDIQCWFLPMFGLDYDDIKVRNTLIDEDKNILVALRTGLQTEYASYAEDTRGSRSIGISKSFSFRSEVITLKDGSQVVKAQSPQAILQEITNVNPIYATQLETVAYKAINSTNNTLVQNLPCLVYLFPVFENNKKLTNFLTWDIPLRSKIFLPTVENNHYNPSDSLDEVVDMDGFVFWGGKRRSNNDHKAGLDNTEGLVVPSHVYGKVSLEAISALGNGIDNGFLGINFEDEDPKNLELMEDSAGITMQSIF